MVLATLRAGSDGSSNHRKIDPLEVGLRAVCNALRLSNLGVDES